MRKLLLVLAFCLIPVMCPAVTAMQTGAGQVELAWTHSISTDVVGYKVYYSGESSIFSDHDVIGYTDTYTVTGLAEGTWYFVVTAFDAAGNESGFSNEVSTEVVAPDTTAPEAPTGLSIISMLWAAIKWFFGWFA